MENRFVCSAVLMGKGIVAEVTTLDYGMHVLVSGGEKTHIGAVSVMDREGNITTSVLPEHKEQVITETWARELFDIVKEPVCVVAGIHYDYLSKEQIMEVISETDQLLERCKAKLKLRN